MNASPPAARRLACFILFLCWGMASPPLAAEIAFSGRLKARGALALDSDSTKADPSLNGHFETDIKAAASHFHAEIEGGVDGTVTSPRQDNSLGKEFDEVYQDRSPCLEVKELYLERSLGRVELAVGIQRFAWGKLDEYPVNDLFNPWDYSQFLTQAIEERKIGVPALSIAAQREDWAYQAVWVPWHVPYRLAKPSERWSGIPIAASLAAINGAEVRPKEEEVPNVGSFGFRLQRLNGAVEWTASLFHGYDPRPVFRSTALRVEEPEPGRVVVDPGYVPAFQRMTALGADLDTVLGGWSLRAEAAYAWQRHFNPRPELWGYPETISPGSYPLAVIEAVSDTLDYGLAADYRLFEDALLTVQAQQTLLVDRPGTLYERRVETILWADLKVGWLNGKVETGLNLAWNPEHGAEMLRVKAYYILTDHWKAGVTLTALDGPPLSLFGRYGNNDQIETEVVVSW